MSGETLGLYFMFIDGKTNYIAYKYLQATIFKNICAMGIFERKSKKCFNNNRIYK